MKRAFLAVVLLAAVPSTSLASDALFDDEAEEDPLVTSIHVYPLVEDFTWREYSQGAQSLEEKGDRYGAGATATFESGSSVYRLKGEYFRGTGDAKGVTGGSAWATKVREYGFRLEGDAGLKIPIGRASIEPYGGLGYRWWRRRYEDSATVVGLLEKWHAVHFKLGALAEYDLGRWFVPYVEAAVRLGIFTSNEIDYYGARVRLNSSGRVTPYAEAGLRLGILKGAVYYERLEFGESDPEAVPGLPPGFELVQPEVKADIFGARVGLSF